MTLSRRLLVGAPLILAAMPVRAQLRTPPASIPAKWYAVQVEDGAFQIEMPGIPDNRRIDDRSAKGTPFVFHSYSLEVGSTAYVVQTALYPADVDTRQPRPLLQAALDARAQPLAGRKWKSVNWRDLQGAPTAETVGALPNGTGLRQMVMLRGSRFVSLAFLGPEATLTGQEAQRFFNSLKFR
jgi:hypothetical protein